LYITELASGNRIGEVAKRYNVTEKEVENTILSNRNRSGGTPKDYAIEFLFVTEKGYSVENMIKEVYSIPSTILFLFRLPVQNWKWIIDIIGWMLFFTIILALINYVRRGTK